MNKRVKYILIGVGIIILIILIVPYFSIKNSKSDKEDPMDKYYWDNREKVNLEMGKYVESLNFSEGYRLRYALAVGYPDETPEAKARDLSKIKFVE